MSSMRDLATHRYVILTMLLLLSLGEVRADRLTQSAEVERDVLFAQWVHQLVNGDRDPSYAFAVDVADTTKSELRQRAIRWSLDQWKSPLVFVERDTQDDLVIQGLVRGVAGQLGFRQDVAVRVHMSFTKGRLEVEFNDFQHTTAAGSEHLHVKAYLPLLKGFALEVLNLQESVVRAVSTP